jgi:hypothetical protein
LKARKKLRNETSNADEDDNDETVGIKPKFLYKINLTRKEKHQGHGRKVGID